MVLLITQRHPITFIKYLLPQDAVVSIKIFDMLGEEVRTLLDRKFQKAGTHTIEFDDSDIPRGVYVCQLETAPNNRVRRIVLMNGRRNGMKSENAKVES